MELLRLVNPGFVWILQLLKGYDGPLGVSMKVKLHGKVTFLPSITSD